MTPTPSHDSDDATPSCSNTPRCASALPLDDVARLNALNRLGICSRESSGAFERCVRLAQRSLQARTCLIVLVDADSQFIKARTHSAEEPNDDSLHSAVLQLNRTVVETNAPLMLCDGDEVQELSSAGLKSIPLKAYLGHPIRTPDGFAIGALVALEFESRAWPISDQDAVRDVVALVESEIGRIHESLLATAKQRATENRYKKVLGQADCLIWDAEVTSTTSGWEWQFTIQPSGLGLRLFDSKIVRNQNGPWEQFAIADQALMNQRSRQAMQSGQTGYNQDFQVRRPNGTNFWIHESVTISNLGGNRFWLVGVATEITHQKHLEAELHRVRDRALDASRLKSQFLANMSHELRTPMNGIVGMASVLMETELDDNQQRISQVIQESGDSLLAIINDVLDLSKIEAGMLTIEPGPVDLKKLVLAITDLLAPHANRKGITIACEISDRLPPTLLGDGKRLRQIITNLAGNAVNYTDQGMVTVTVEVLAVGEGDCELRLTVADTGPGIPEDVQKKLFQPFVQADNASTLGRGGTGLGLAISKQLIERMGGTIDMDSEPGSGSAFSIELCLDINESAESEPPAAIPAHSPLPPPLQQSPTSTKTTRRAHVLVVEDNPTNQVVVTLILNGMGITHEVTNNGQEGLDALRAHPFDAVLMDCQMPVLDGYAATECIRSGAVPGVNPKIPVIALTAYAMVGDRERCLSVGMNEHVSKPIRTAELRAALERCGVIAVETRRAPVLTSNVSSLMDPELVAEYRELPGERHATVLEDLIEHYLRTTAQNIETLRERIESGNQDESAQLAHTLAGTCANLGAKSVRSALIAVEKAVRNSTIATALEQLDACEILLAQLNREAQDLLATAA